MSNDFDVRSLASFAGFLRTSGAAVQVPLQEHQIDPAAASAHLVI
jgi:hypothetical protein